MIQKLRVFTIQKTKFLREISILMSSEAKNVGIMSVCLLLSLHSLKNLPISIKFDVCHILAICRVFFPICWIKQNFEVSKYTKLLSSP